MSTTQEAGSGVRFEVGGGIARVTLDRPDQRNSLGLSMADGLLDAFSKAREDGDVRVVLLSATGPMFCPGGDVVAMAAAPDRSAFLHDLAGRAHEAMLVLAALPVPVVTAVQGSAAGAGLALVLHSDLVVCEPDAKFVTAYLGIGVTPDCGLSLLLPRVVGPRRASLMALAGAVVRGPQALDWGLVTEVSEPGKAGQRALDLASRIAAGPASAVAGTKRLLQDGWDRSLAAHLDAERESIARLVGESESRALIDAFVNR